jgi:hypothetical protein
MPDRGTENRLAVEDGADGDEIDDRLDREDPYRAQRNALRAYLQRAETRLSTLHRIAGVFLNGAGLLVLFPILLRDVLPSLIGALSDWNGASEFYAPLTVAVAIAFTLPIWALYLLVRDLVRFYFTGYHFGIDVTSPHPRFVLTGIEFSRDEGMAAADAVARYRNEHTDLLNLAVPPGQRSRRKLDALIRSEGMQSLIDSNAYEDLRPNLGSDQRPSELCYLYTAFGLTGTRNRSLIEETAKLEISLVKHTLSLRTLVLRYAKALILLIVNALAYLVALGVLNNWGGAAVAPGERVVFFAVVIGVGAAITGFVVRLPLVWITSTSGVVDPDPGRVGRESDLIQFERIVVLGSTLAYLLASWSVIHRDEVWTDATSDPVWALLLFGAPFALVGVYGTLAQRRGSGIPRWRRSRRRHFPESR